MKCAAIFLACLAAPGLAQTNSPPVVEAGESQTIYLGDTAYLHGTATDPDGDQIGDWQWEVISAPGGSVYSIGYANTASPHFATDTLGDYIITAIATDGIAWSQPDALVVTVVLNRPPTAVISASPLSGPVPLVVNFDGSASFDPEGGVLSYYWAFGDGSYATGVTASHEFITPGWYTVRLRVSDDHANFDFEYASVEVSSLTVSPRSHDFGEVGVGQSSSVIFTVADPWAGRSLTGVAVDPPGAFTVSVTPALPVLLTAEAVVDVEVVFTPSAVGSCTAELVIQSDDYYASTFRLPLRGTGVTAEPPPVTVAQILSAFDLAVLSGALVGDGPGNSAAGRCGALRNMIEAVDDLILAGETERACAQLEDAMKRCDGDNRPPDFVIGVGAPLLWADLEALRLGLGCS